MRTSKGRRRSGNQEDQPPLLAAGQEQLRR
jgi:hypothetical protein